jgi:hypothetical protein
VLITGGHCFAFQGLSEYSNHRRPKKTKTRIEPIKYVTADIVLPDWYKKAVPPRPIPIHRKM